MKHQVTSDNNDRMIELLIQAMGAPMLDVVLPLTDQFHYLFDIEIMLILFYTIFQHYISVFGTLDLICP